MPRKMKAAIASEDRDAKTGRFLTGNSGGGRQLGSRNKLGELFLAALAEDFEQNGASAIAECRIKKPDKYLSVCAGLMPKEAVLAIEHDITHEHRFMEFVSVLRTAQAVQAAAKRTGYDLP